MLAFCLMFDSSIGMLLQNIFVIPVYSFVTQSLNAKISTSTALGLSSVDFCGLQYCSSHVSHRNRGHILS